MADDKDEDEGKEDEGNDNDDDEDEGEDDDDEDEGEDDGGKLRATANAHANSLFSLSTSLVSSSILSLFTSSAIEYSAAPKSQLEWLSCCESLAS